jgi:hypothetical protein
MVNLQQFINISFLSHIQKDSTGWVVCSVFVIVHAPREMLEACGRQIWTVPTTTTSIDRFSEDSR